MLANKLLSASSPSGWDLSKAVYNGVFPDKFYVGSQEITPTGLSFKDDGTKMYIIGTNQERIQEFDLSTAWDVTTASFVQSLLVSARDGTPSGLFFKPDGTGLYFCGDTNDRVYQYSLSTAWNLSTASFVRSYLVSGQGTNPNNLFFKEDGTKMYVVDQSGDEVNEYSLSTAWDISTTTFVRRFSTSTQFTDPRGIFFRPGGTKMYITGGSNVYEYNLSTAWNISTTSFVQSFSLIGLNTSIFFKDDGTKMYYINTDDDSVYQNNLSTAWNVSTASYQEPSTNYFSISSQDTNPRDIFFKPDGTKMYIVGNTNDSVFEYNLSTAWDIVTSSYVQSFSVASQEITPQGIFFKTDGTKMYIVGVDGDDVNEYNLSTAWNISTASYVQSFSVSAQETIPQTISFKPDGTKMYVLGTSGDDVNEYNLSTAWDVSTASYVQVFLVSSQFSFPYGLYFKSDGTKMYVCGTLGSLGGRVSEYSLSTPWDISTASFVVNFSVNKQDSDPHGIFFKDDGRKMYIVGDLNIAILSYDL